MTANATSFKKGNPGGPGKPTTRSTERKRDLESKLLELELAEKQGTLCKADDVRDTYASFIRAVKTMLDGLGPQVSSAGAVALKLDADGQRALTDAVGAQVDAARKMIVEEWRRIGAENHATRQ